jgi:hypothetical protein
MNNLKMLALFGGVVATSAHRRHGKQDEHLRELLHRKEEFLTSCSEEVPMCEEMIAEANAQLVIVDPTTPPNGENSDSGSPASNPSDIVHQCIVDSLAACQPALNSKDPASITQCVVDNRREIIENLKDLSPECQEAFLDLLRPHRRRRHDHDEHDGDDDDDDDDDDNDANRHDRDEHDGDDDRDNDMMMRLSAPGAEIGACLMKNTQNMSVTCRTAVENVVNVNATTEAAVWDFLDAEPQGKDYRHWPLFHWIGSFFFIALILCCCVRARKRRKCSRGTSPANTAAAPQPRIAMSTGPSVQTAFPVEDEDPELARAIAASMADTGRTSTAVTPTAPPASYQPPRVVDVAYTGKEPFMQAGALHSDQYV